MNRRLDAGVVADATGIGLVHEPVGFDQVVGGTPTTGIHEMDDSTGVWEMSPGAMSDTEADEVFVVIAGDATVDFTDPPLPSIVLRPGSVVRLEAGMRTVWTVRETLRKVYLAR